MHLVSQLVRAGQSYHQNCKFQFYNSTPCLQMQFPLLDCSRKGLRLSSPCLRSSAFSGSTFSTVMPSTPRPMVSAVGIPLRETIGERWSIHVTTNIQNIYDVYCMMFLVIYDVLCECILFLGLRIMVQNVVQFDAKEEFTTNNEKSLERSCLGQSARK